MKLSPHQKQPRFRYPPQKAPRPLNPFVILSAIYMSLMLTVIAADAVIHMSDRSRSASATATVQAIFQALPTRAPYPTRVMPYTPTPPGGYP